MSAVCTTLESNNRESAVSPDAALSGSTALSDANGNGVLTQAPDATDDHHRDHPLWEVRPPSTWFKCPLGRRELVGQSLVQAAQAKAVTAALGVHDQGEAQAMDQPCPSLWDSPFLVGSLNVGFRGLSCSLRGLVGLVEEHRPDVLFLADLRTPRHKIGRLRKDLERELGDEWFLLSDISAATGMPTGIGAVLHTSLARCVTKLEVICPPGLAQESWTQAVQGRIMLLQLSRPDQPSSVWFIGLYQHVASNANERARELVLLTLGHLRMLAAAGGHRLVLVGDVNSAPRGGRWGYSPRSRVLAADKQMEEWAVASEMCEIFSSPLQATWRACLHPRKAVLDRAWVHPPDLQVSSLSVHWAAEKTIFDHAMILVSMPQAVAGIGYAGACRPLRQSLAASRCRVDLRRWKERLEEWTRLVRLNLAVPDIPVSDPLPDPFQALKHGELVADSVAQALAPKGAQRPGESFGFGGHRCLHRELNLLQGARILVHNILHSTNGIHTCPSRVALWKVTMARLGACLRRSHHPRPPVLFRQAAWYFTPGAKPSLRDWLAQAKFAADVRWATIREHREKARYLNIQQLRKRLTLQGGVLDSYAIQAALGKCKPRPRMWGVSGVAALGVSLVVTAAQHAAILEHLSTLSAAVGIQRVVGTDSAIQLWFRGPRPLGDFLLQWCCSKHPWSSTRLCTLDLPGQFLAITPDDMMAVQELHMAAEGMDSESICPNCRMPGVKPIVTSATAQQHGNPGRIVRFLCTRCTSVHDDVAVADLPPCPVPLNIWRALRKIPRDSPPLVCRPVDFSTLEECVRRLPKGRSPGMDGIPYEYYTHGPPELLELLRAAINAYLRGDTPTVGIQDWTGGLVTLVDKITAAVAIRDRRPITNLCTKYKVATTIINRRLTRVLEDYNILDEAQEGFRRHRNTKRQLSKLHSIFQNGQRRRCLSVVLYLDIKNAFNAVNHRVIFSSLEACGFPQADVDLFRRLYTGTWYSVGNPFGESAACYLRRGMKQGDPPSSTMFTIVFNPMHKMLRASGRGSSLQALSDPTGASGFADDTSLHTDGPDALAAMQILVTIAGTYLNWTGLMLNMLKSFISAINYATGLQVATDHITFDGTPFAVVRPDQAHKHLGVRTTMTGDFSAEKAHVREEMLKRLDALKQDTVLSPSEKELVIKIGIVTVFRYSSGLVPWTRTELEGITNMWIRGYKQAWTQSRSSDSSPMSLCRRDGGRECPSAIEVWTRDVLDLLDQCISLPGEIASIALYRLQDACQSWGCLTLDQLQRMLRIGGRADSIIELLLQRLDEQGLEVSSPWEPPAREEQLIAAALWPRLWRVWKVKETWLGCTELSEDLRVEWDQARVCLSAIRRLGRAGLLTVSQLMHSGGGWLGRSALMPAGYRLSASEHTTLMQWLTTERLDTPRPGLSVLPDDRQATVDHPQPCAPTRHWPSVPRASGSAGVIRQPLLPPYLKGKVRSVAPHDCLELESVIDPSIPDTPLEHVSDSQLVATMCHSRSVFSFTLDGHKDLTVECLVPLSRVWQHQPQQEFVVVSEFGADTPDRLAALAIPFLRDCLLANGVDTLQDACTRPPWLVARADLPLHRQRNNLGINSSHQQWRLESGGIDGQQVLRGVACGIQPKRGRGGWQPLVVLHPWQSDPPLPDRVRVDLSNHFPQSLPSPEGWEICQRNARVLITDPFHRTVGISSAQYGMLKTLMHSADPTTAPPAESFLVSVRTSCLSQAQADSTHHVHWSRHLLTCLRNITSADVLVGARAVTFNPHFQHFSSPDPADAGLGAVYHWPAMPMLLVLDSFQPSARQEILQRASQHARAVWILRQEKPTDSSARDQRTLVHLQARLCAQLPKGSLVLHEAGCWSESRWDPIPARHASQIWLLRTDDPSVSTLMQPLALQHALGDWNEPRFDFHWRDDPLPLALQRYRAQQQDAVQYTWPGDLGWICGRHRRQCRLST